MGARGVWAGGGTDGLTVNYRDDDLTGPRRAALDRFLNSWQADDEIAEATAAMADHGDGSSYGNTIVSQHLVSPLTGAYDALQLLATEWIVGYGPDGAFVNVAGPGAPGDHRFPSLLALMLELHVRKNTAYVGQTSPDPLANYVSAGRAIGVPGYRAAFMRLAEKVSRLTNTMQKDITNPDDGELIQETLLDVAVIALLTISLYERGR